MTDPAPDGAAPDDAAAVVALQAAVGFPTISYRDLVAVDLSAFEALAADLRTRFPRLFAVVEPVEVPSGGIGHSLLLRWPGRDPAAAPVVLMAHQDVVPIQADEWTHPPFGAEIVGSQTGDADRRVLYGRGALDDKAALVGLCVAAERLLADGFGPRRDIWFAFGCDEEVAGTAAAATVEVLAAHDVEPWFVLDEGGAVVPDGLPGQKADLAMIGVAEKGYLDLQLRAQDDGGHASTPRRGGAVARLAAALIRLDDQPFAVAVPEPTVRMLAQAARCTRWRIRLALSVLTRYPRLLGRVLVRLGPEAAAMTRTTTAITQLTGSPGPNVLATSATAVVNLRIMPGESTDGTVQRVRSVVGDDSVAVTVLSASEPSPLAPVDDDAYRLLADTVRTALPGVTPVPYVVMAATDGRFFQRRWPRVYRFTPFRVDRAARGGLHNNDEHLPVAAYLAGIDWYRALLARL